MCNTAREVWRKLGRDKTVLEILLLLPDQDLSILGLLNAREIIAITACYLWWVIRKLVNEAIVQDAY